MARELIQFFNASSDGQGLEGFISWSNNVSDNLLMPMFLLVFYGLFIYILSEKTNLKISSAVLYSSTIFWLISMVAQTFVTFNQAFIFMFIIGILVGIVMTFIENAK